MALETNSDLVLSAKEGINAAEGKVKEARAKHFAAEASNVEDSLGVCVELLATFNHNPDFWSSEHIETRIATLVRMDKAMGRISLRVAHQLGKDLLKLKAGTPRGEWKDRVLSFGMEYRRAVRYMLIATVFPYVDHLEDYLGIFTVSGALDACKVAKDNKWLRGNGSCNSFRYGDLKEKLAELDVDPKAYDKTEGQYLLPPPATPSKEADNTATATTTTDHVEEDTSDAIQAEADETETDATEDDDSEEDATETEESPHNTPDYLRVYGNVFDALKVIDMTLLKMQPAGKHWPSVADCGPASRETLTSLLKSIKGRVDAIINAIGDPPDKAPEVEYDDAGDVSDADVSDESVHANDMAELDSDNA